MQTILDSSIPHAWKTSAVIAVLFEDDTNTVTQLSAELLTAAPWLKDALALHDFHAKKDELVVLYAPTTHAITRVILCGLGKAQKVNKDLATQLAAVRNAFAAAARHCRALRLDDMAISFPDLCKTFANKNAEALVREAVCGALLGLHRQTAHKSAKKKEALDPNPNKIVLLGASEALQHALIRAESEAGAICLARDLVNTPPNVLTPTALAEQALALASAHAESGLHCEVLERDALEREKMGAFLAVAAGSATEPRLVVLEYAHPECQKEQPLLVVGKGLTFDSGGISLKPSLGMEAMKGDMGGAAAVLGLFAALGQLRPYCRVVGLMACAENMPGSAATRPGDVVTSFSGKTIEIINTDAEGRLVLCDTLSYAQHRWQPKLLLDIATLTGACVVALGKDVAGVFSRDEALSRRVCEEGTILGETAWPLPLWDMYFEALKSNTADFANVGGREGGSCSAAAFLAQFVDEKTPWVHIDIAGPALKSKGNALHEAGGTGFGVRTLLALALAEAQERQDR